MRRAHTAPAFSQKNAILMSIPRKDIRPGMRVHIVLKKDQRSGNLTEGVVKQLLTRSPTHPHGIKVRLEDDRVGRVKAIL